jgi:hypothetical protein
MTWIIVAASCFDSRTVTAPRRQDAMLLRRGSDFHVPLYGQPER